MTIYISLPITGQCDAIVLMPGWMANKGCTLEYQCALIYGFSSKIQKIENLTD